MPFSPRTAKNAIWRYLVLPDDDPVTAFNKKITFIGCITSIIMNAWVQFLATEGSTVERQRGVPGLLASCVTLFPLLWQRKLNYLLIEVSLYLYGVSFLYGDMRAVTINAVRTWPYFILLNDYCMVCRLKPRICRNLIVILMLWFALLAVESTARVGVFDMPIFPDQQQRHELVNCTKLPCSTPVGTSAIVFAFHVMVFLLDYYFTRGFARDLQEEHVKMNRVISAATSIASCLSRFDLLSAEAFLASSTLPEPIHKTFSEILSNLEQYRPYLPDALFAELHSSSECVNTDIPVPGLVSKHATLVFTDIQGSTVVWEACPAGMQEGLREHNNVIRRCIGEHRGYEVKTIGDAFMVAFDSAAKAVAFALSTQEELVAASWPPELLDLSMCSYKENGLWCGLRVRIGIHSGPVDVQLNTVTGRYDYFGSTVNKAARIEGVCVGGAVSVTPEVLEEAKHLGDVCIMPMGETRLRGVSGVVYPSLLLPRSLALRKSFVEEQVAARRSGNRRRSTVKTQRSANDGTVSARTSHSLENTANALTHVVSASIGVIEIQLLEGSPHTDLSVVFNEMLSKVAQCVERTHGVLVSLQGPRVAIGWNTTKQCHTHIDNSLAFVKMLWWNILHTAGDTLTDNEDDAGTWGGLGSRYFVGLAVGDVRHGVVSSARQKFMTILGKPVDMSMQLCGTAKNEAVYCLYATGSYRLSRTDMTFRLRSNDTTAEVAVYEVTAPPSDGEMDIEDA